MSESIPNNLSTMIIRFLFLLASLTLPELVGTSKTHISDIRSLTPPQRLIGRHVCIRNKVVTRPTQQVESYCKPVYKTYMYVCDKEKYRLCSTFRVIYENAYRTVQKISTRTETLYVCCPGWSRAIHGKHDCNKPVCTQNCQNGGRCNKPDHCICSDGWTGKSCQTDVDECLRENGKCDHWCVNTPGSYGCKCHRGFNLREDEKSCEMNLGTLLEYRQFVENYKELTERVTRLEKFQRDYNLTEVMVRLDTLSETVNSFNKSPWEYGIEESPLDRINSLSEQIAILEERLGSCSCHQNTESNYAPRG